MLGLYRHGESVLHRLPAGSKLLGLVIAGTAIFLIANPFHIAGILVLVCVAYRIAGLDARTLIAQIRPALWLLALIFALQLWLNDWQAGALVTLRLSTLILLASLVTLTTQVSAMLAAMERGLAPLRHFGVDPSRVSLALSMALRFIPLIADVTAQVREAQKARGLERSVIAVAVPVILRLLKMADDIADAIDARS
ncbi:energy-coupling factor transporter transmembrane component T family protein [Pararhizobium haloflavum]|uniref:energy-coupling factor transporter transmembrane component T family protein n=1 Tax=Pararhizobium haloflavum TaxID=2037914 RepID=UPI001FDF9E26|nr:energy-coupling factor transporter transmembrane protein EcfT [Pararhizobium haloflavum]